MAQVGRRIYYDNRTGTLILDTGERAGSIRETTVDEDFESYKALSDRVRNTVGVLELDYGAYHEELLEGWIEGVNLETESPIFILYDKPEVPVEIPQNETIRAKILNLEDENALLAMELAQTKAQTTGRIDVIEQDQADLLLSLAAKGVP